MQSEAVDVIDRKIIDQLRIDGRRSFGEIGRYVGLSEAAVRTRYRRLLSLGIVQVVGMPHPIRMGLQEARMSVRVRGAAVATVAAALAELPEVRFVGASIGRFDLSVDIRCTDGEELSSLLFEKVRRIPGIETVEVASVVEVVKDEYMWAGFREPVDRPWRPHPTSGTAG